jgi:hypothetical protein
MIWLVLLPLLILALLPLMVPLEESVDHVQAGQPDDVPGQPPAADDVGSPGDPA